MQKTTLRTRLLPLLPVLLLIAISAMILASCGGKTLTENDPFNPSKTIGDGQMTLQFRAVSADGTVTDTAVKTDADTVGRALLDAGLISGDDGPFGLYIKTVSGETHDYDTDGSYWAFYIDGAYAMTGADTTPIDPAALYTFKAEKG